MKKARLILLAILIIGMLTTMMGCGGTSGKGKGQLEDTTINGEEAKNLTFIRPGQNADDTSDPVVKAIREYEKLYNVKVEIMAADYDTWTTKVLSASTAGTPIDVIFGSVSEYPLFAMKGYTQPISQYVDLDADYASRSASEAFFSFKNEIYVTSVADPSPLMMYYNKDMIEAEGLTDPLELYNNGQWNFETFRDMCKAITTDTDGDGNVDRWGLCSWYSWAWLGANHTALCNITKDGTYELNMSSPAVVQTLEYVQDMYYHSKWRGLDGDNIFTSFYQGRNAFLNEYSWVETSHIIPAKEEGQFDFEYGVVPMPYGPNNTEKYNVAHASGYSIGTGSANPYHAGKLIGMILDSVQKDAAVKNEKVPADHLELYKSLSAKIYNDTYYDSAIKNGSDLFALVCGGSNIQTSISSITPVYQGFIDDANEAAAG